SKRSGPPARPRPRRRARPAAPRARTPAHDRTIAPIAAQDRARRRTRRHGRRAGGVRCRALRGGAVTDRDAGPRLDIGVPREVAIVMLSALGDAVHVLPVVNALKRAWPDTRIT